MGRKYKPRRVPEQDRRICGIICLCQFTIVISCVSLVYLTVAVYIPSHRAFQSGFEAKPVMCQTVNTTLANACLWASCGEWCLTKSTGSCSQIHATVRRNGTDLVFENCTKTSTIACPQANMGNAMRYNCNNGTECSAMHGVFNCSKGHCSNMSELMLCHHTADGIVLDTEKDNMKLNGFFECEKTRCVKIKKPFTCDRYCPKIGTGNVNVFLMQADNIITATCNRAFALNRANGGLPGSRLASPHKVWEDKSDVIIASCFAVRKDMDKLRTEDCVNGTLFEEAKVPQPYVNFTTFLKLYEKSLSRSLDPSNAFIPDQRVLTIYNTSRLFINLEGCVNTLRGECREFLLTHGQDGDNQTAQSRYPCFYHKNDSSFVIARFDLRKTELELLIAAIVPSVLFVISLTTLIIITRSVRVDDDTKMRCRCCGDKQENQDEDEGLMTKSRNSRSSNGDENEVKSIAL